MQNVLIGTNDFLRMRVFTYFVNISVTSIGIKQKQRLNNNFFT